jgi:RNA polymerase sigma-70 factor, ECF subfamily
MKEATLPAPPAAIALTPARDPRSDETLISDILAGRGGEFETLVRRHQHGIYAFLLRMVREPEEAADLAQEVFLKVFANLEQYNPAFRFKTWLYRIAANAAVDRRRRRRTAGFQVRLDSGEEGGSTRLPSGAPGPDEILTARETRERLESALAEMPPSYRKVLLMRFQGDLQYNEIAAITQLPLGTVKNRIFRAREMLKRALQ